MTVLIVDDDTAIRLLCRVNLELEGLRVVEAAYLDQARQVLAEEPVDVVLLDLHLGHERGLDLLHELRRDRPEIGVALLTGSPQVPLAKGGGEGRRSDLEAFRDRGAGTDRPPSGGEVGSGARVTMLRR